MPDRTIILTIVEEAWTGSGSVLDLFLESFRVGQGTKRLLNHLLIATVGKGAFEYCKSVHPHCFKLAPLRLSKPAAGKQLLGHGREGIDLLHRVIQLGYNLIFTEADVMWFRKPVTEFDSQKEVTIPCDLDSENAGNKQDRGIFFLKSDVISLEFFEYLNLVGILYPSIPLGSPCEIVTREEITKMLGMRVQIIDTAYFGGFCQPLGNYSEVYTMQANCCENIESKVHDLKLVLDDWRSITGRSANNSSGQSPSWRAPNKCIQ
ncbi:hypothetical protein PS2_023022 [Malus domestica]